jgi:glycosyltransferase involved in cell wall biosynthesis
VIIDKRFLSKNDIARIQKASKLSLGQMASHERLNRTIPHKAYESAFLRSPYLTGRNPGILEIFSEKKEVFCFNPGDPQDLAVKIYETLENSKEREKVKNAMSVKYNLTLNQKILARQFLVEVQSLK